MLFALLVVCLILALAGGAVVHPLVFVLALVFLWLIFTNWPGRAPR